MDASIAKFYFPSKILPPICNSDHKVVWLRQMKTSSHHNNNAKKIKFKIMDLSTQNLINFHKHLASFGFKALDSTINVNSMVDSFYTIISNSIKSIPVKLICKNPKDKPWINNTIKILIVK